jgi:hypothetical protein
MYHLLQQEEEEEKRFTFYLFATDIFSLSSDHKNGSLIGAASE